MIAADLRREAANLHRAGRPVEALPLLRALVKHEPHDFGAHYNLGLTLQHLARWEEAISAYKRAIALNPEFPDAHVNLGNCQQHLGHHAEAEVEFRKATELRPGLAQGHLNLGMVLKRLGRWDESVEPLRRALELAPQDARAWDHLYDSLMTLRRPDEAAKAFVAWEPVAPECPEIALAGLTLSRLLADEERQRRYLDLCIRWPFPEIADAQLAELLAQVQYYDASAQDILRLYQRYRSVMRTGFENYSGQMKRTKGERIRLGYLSPDFRTHVMGKLMRHVFRLHDRDRYELFAFSLADARHEDELTDDFRELSRRFVNVSALSDQQAARLIADHDLDILVDLAGHTQGSRPAILAFKPARVVITHLGYHGCTGLEQVDYKLTDRLADGPENEQFQIEKLLFMDSCIFPFDHVEPSDEADYSRARLGLEGRFVFGEFVNLMKLSPRLLSAWARIFRELPEAVVAFSPIAARDETLIVAAMAKAGLGRDRVFFLPVSKDDRVRRARYQALDAVLDTFPYSGGDTTLAALDGHVPVIALAGKRHAERTSASILGHLGLDELVARTDEEYVEKAIRLARDETFRESVKTRLRSAMVKKRGEGLGPYVRSLERAYEAALKQRGVLTGDTSSLTVDEFQGAFRAGLAAHQAGDLASALEAYEALSREQPSYPPLNYFFAMLLRSMGNKARARDCLRRAIEASPSYVDAQIALGNLELDAGNHEVACQIFETAAGSRPDRTEAWTGLGLSLQARGDNAGAVEALKRAVAASPSDPLAHFNLATALQKVQRTDESLVSYRMSLAIRPDSVETLFNYGMLLSEMGQRDLAIGAWRASRSASPAFEPAYLQLRHALHAAGRIEEWLSNFDEFALHHPDSPRLPLYAIDVAVHRGDLGEALRRFRQAVEAVLSERQDDLAAELLEELLYVALFFDIGEGELLAMYRRYDEASRALCPQLPLLPPRAGEAKIRIGYLSADFRDHVMGRMTMQILSRHDRSAFEVLGFSLSLGEDAVTQNIRSHCDHFRNLSGLSDRAAAEAITEHGLDILVDLSTHTKGSRPAILAFKPARVQITHVASAGALGLSTVDFKLTDRLWDLPENQGGLIERLLPMDGCVFPFPGWVRATKPAVSRFEIGLAPDDFVYGAFVQLQKLSAPLLATWRGILERVPRARLAFSPLAADASFAYERLLEANGIDRGRAVFIPQGPTPEHSQARYLHVDAVLDTFPYSGTNGTMEALQQAVPVVALAGRRACERSSVTILANSGLDELVTESREAYVELAVRLATDARFTAGIRESIDRKLPGSILADNDAYVRNLEAAYRRALAEANVVVGA